MQGWIVIEGDSAGVKQLVSEGNGMLALIQSLMGCSAVFEFSILFDLQEPRKRLFVCDGPKRLVIGRQGLGTSPTSLIGGARYKQI